MTYLRMYCNSFPIVLNIKNSFSKFEETLTYFNQIEYLYYCYYYCSLLLLLLYYYYILRE